MFKRFFKIWPGDLVLIRHDFYEYEFSEKFHEKLDTKCRLWNFYMAIEINHWFKGDNLLIITKLYLQNGYLPFHFTIIMFLSSHISQWITFPYSFNQIHPTITYIWLWTQRRTTPNQYPIIVWKWIPKSIKIVSTHISMNMSLWIISLQCLLYYI